MKAMEKDWYKKNWMMDIQNMLWVEDTNRQVDYLYGELYSLLYIILPASYREWSSPSESYDAMIYVANAHPTKINENR